MNKRSSTIDISHLTHQIKVTALLLCSFYMFWCAPVLGQSAASILDSDRPFSLQAITIAQQNIDSLLLLKQSNIAQNISPVYLDALHAYHNGDIDNARQLWNKYENSIQDDIPNFTEEQKAVHDFYRIAIKESHLSDVYIKSLLDLDSRIYTNYAELKVELIKHICAYYRQTMTLAPLHEYLSDLEYRYTSEQQSQHVQSQLMLEKAEMFYLLGLNNKSIEVVKNALDYLQRHNLNEGLIKAYSILALCYSKTKDSSNAYYSLHQARVSTAALGSELQTIAVREVLWQCENAFFKNPDNQIKELKKLIESYEALGQDYHTAKNAVRLAEILLEDKNPKQAISILQKYEDVSLQNTPLASSYYLLLTNAYNITGDSPNAVKNLNLYLESSQNISQSHIADNISPLITNLEKVKRSQSSLLSDQQLEAQQELLRSRTSNQNLLRLIIALMSGSILIIIILWVKQRHRALELEKANAEIALQYKALTQTQKSLKAVNEELESFVHVTSHDIKEPLRTIKSFADLLTMKAKGMDQNTKEYLDYLCKAAYRLNNLVQDISNYAITRKDINQGYIDMEAIINATCKELNEDIKNKQALITQYSQWPPIWGNEALIQQCMNQLMKNALRYNVPDRTPIIDIQYMENEKYNIIQVKDNGRGIPTEYLDDIFKPYFRLDKRVDGSGLGLSICKKNMNILGGNIRVESKLHEYTLFELLLPKKANSNNLQEIQPFATDVTTTA